MFELRIYVEGAVRRCWRAGAGLTEGQQADPELPEALAREGKLVFVVEHIRVGGELDRLA